MVNKLLGNPIFVIGIIGVCLCATMNCSFAHRPEHALVICFFTCSAAYGGFLMAGGKISNE